MIVLKLGGNRTKVIAIAVGAFALSMGANDAIAQEGTVVTPINILSGGTLLVLVWVGNRISKVAENFFDSQAEKLIALPTAEVLAADKHSLFEKLEAFGRAADEERRALQSFREDLAGQLADHSARIRILEERITR